MGIKDDLLKARAAELKRSVNKLQREFAHGQPETAEQRSERRLWREILEAVGQLQEEMENVTERLDRLERQSGR
ncbi:MAG TPA: hypothetical protein VJ875_25220 [Pyrinomonadaceae bacterium]|nr:hypothetical protein [Pyrinomonadaceae bacterium]